MSLRVFDCEKCGMHFVSWISYHDCKGRDKELSYIEKIKNFCLEAREGRCNTVLKNGCKCSGVDCFFFKCINYKKVDKTEEKE